MNSNLDNSPILKKLERENESTRVQQSYVELRTQFAKWKEALSNHRRPDRFMITSKWIIVSLLEAIDQFITARLVNIALIKDLNSLDKEPLAFTFRINQK